MKKLGMLVALALTASASLANASSFHRAHRIDRNVRFDDRRAWGDDAGPRRYRTEWVALASALDLCDGRATVTVRDPDTFTQLRLQGTARVDRVVIAFADGSTQIAPVRGAIRDRMEIALDGNNRQIARVTVLGEGALQVFAI